MDFSAQLQVTAVVRRWNGNVIGGPDTTAQITAAATGPAYQIDLYIETDDTDLEPGDYIEITGNRSRS